MASPESVRTQCCVVGGGPAGMMCGFLLARAGVDVTVLEKHKDFLRDFRGDTIHPSTMELMHELGLLEEFLRLPHQEMPKIGASIEGTHLVMADFTRLPTVKKCIALMPQWDFLNFVSSKAERYASFHLRMETEATELIKTEEHVMGVRAKRPQGELEIQADLVIGADGRHSTVRSSAKLEVVEYGVPIDVLWLRLPKLASDPPQTLGFIRDGRMMVMLDRGDYWQCAVIIPKGSFDAIKEAGLEAFRQRMASLAPFLGERVKQLESWDAVKLLTVQINRLKEWQRPGLLCIGDSAHAMSPAGGVGINLAIQDAVAAANLLAEKLRASEVKLEDLQAVQKRREFPTRVTQAIQVRIHQRISGGPEGRKSKGLPLPVILLRRLPVLTRLMARLVGIGVRPEHVKVREAARG